jgi:Tol biopolymer transport system component
MRTPLLSLALLAVCSVQATQLEPGPAPACVPQVFAPGAISGADHDAAPAFAPDGRTVWFGRSDGAHSTILESHLEGGQWTMPRTASFSGQWSDMEPAMSPDARFLVFVSNRPADGAGPPLDGFFMGKSFPGGGGNLWRVERTPDGWSTPARLPDTVNSDPSTFAPSVAADGSLWFMHPVDGGRRFRIYRSQWLDGRFQAPLPLPFSDGSTTDVDPAVSPDESFVVFGSSRSPARDMDLFISFRNGATWSAPRNLGDALNSIGSDAEARLSPDARTLYFSSERRSAAAADRGAEWNNGKYNIWRVELASCPRARRD